MNPMCGAKTKGTGKPCQRHPQKNGRCRLHGGLSTGPKTLEGIQRIRKANIIHGYYSKEMILERIAFRELIREFRS